MRSMNGSEFGAGAAAFDVTQYAKAETAMDTNNANNGARKPNTDCNVFTTITTAAVHVANVRKLDNLKKSLMLVVPWRRGVSSMLRSRR